MSKKKKNRVKRYKTAYKAQRDSFTKSRKRLLDSRIVSVDFSIGRKRRFYDDIEERVTSSKPVRSYRKAQEYKNRVRYPFTTSAILLKEKVWRSRRERREALFAKQKAGKGKAGPKLRTKTVLSKIRC